MNTWQDRLGGATFLDLFAGTGAVGLEALSRGANRVVLVEKDASALATLGRVVQDLAETEGKIQVVAADLPHGLGNPSLTREGPFDLVFADPPYDFSAYSELLDGLVSTVHPEGLVALEHRSRIAGSVESVDWVAIETRRYGDSSLSFYRPALVASTRDAEGCR